MRSTLRPIVLGILAFMLGCGPKTDKAAVAPADAANPGDKTGGAKKEARTPAAPAAPAAAQPVTGARRTTKPVG